MWLGLFFVYVDTVYGFYGCLVGCFSMITWMGVLYACVSYFCLGVGMYVCVCGGGWVGVHASARAREHTPIKARCICTCTHVCVHERRVCARDRHTPSLLFGWLVGFFNVVPSVADLLRLIYVRPHRN